MVPLQVGPLSAVTARVARMREIRPQVTNLPMLIYGRARHHSWHPDFASPSHNGPIINYAGMPDVQESMQSVRHKEQVYGANQVAELLLYPRERSGLNRRVRNIKAVNGYARKRIGRTSGDSARNATL